MAETSHAVDVAAMTSLPAMFFAQAKRLGDRPFLWAKVDDTYRPHSWTSVADRIAAVAAGLKAAGVKAGDRIVLVSENFGKELTTAVLWLRDRDIDIRCVRLRPYEDGGRRLIDVQQIIPLPEANEYQVQLREKEQVGRKKRAERYDVRLKFWEGLVAVARNRHTRHANIKPGAYHWLGASSGIRGLGLNYVIVQEYGIAELYIDRGDAVENKRIFDQLHARKDEIEKAFSGAPSWERLDAKRACRIKHVIERGGYRSDKQ